jgi:hypothetical protein
MSSEREVSPADTYMERVKKLIPAEVSAAFLAINSLIPLNSDNNVYVIFFFVILLAICVFYLRQLESVRSLVQIAFISLVAFPIWAANIAIARIDWLQPRAFLASCLLIVATLAIPLIVRKA